MEPTQSEQKCHESIAENALAAPYPPLSGFKRGISSNVMGWFVRKFGIIHPTVRSTSQHQRIDRLPERRGVVT